MACNNPEAWYVITLVLILFIGLALIVVGLVDLASGGRGTWECPEGAAFTTIHTRIMRDVVLVCVSAADGKLVDDVWVPSEVPVTDLEITTGSAMLALATLGLLLTQCCCAPTKSPQAVAPAANAASLENAEKA